MPTHERHARERKRPTGDRNRGTAPWLRGLAGGVFAAAVLSGAAAADDGFRPDQDINLYIGYPAGSAYDAYARLVTDNISRFLPGHPHVLPRNMPGAGSLRVVNYLYQVAPKDGTAWGASSRQVAFEPLLYGKASKAAYKNPLEMNWIASLTSETGVAAVWHTTGVKTWAEAVKKPLIVAMSSAHGGISARAVNSLLHAHFQQVCCYGGGNHQNLAMERGEVEGRIGWSWSSLKATKMNWLKEGKINLLMQVALERNPEIPGNLPLVTDLAQSQRDKNALKIIFSDQLMGRPYVLPPGVPSARVELIRNAFMKMVKDPAFLAQAKRQHLDIDGPKSGPQIEHIIKEAYGAPKDAIAAAREAIKSGRIKMVRQPKKKRK